MRTTESAEELTEYDIEFVEDDDRPGFENSSPLLAALFDLDERPEDQLFPTALDREPVTAPLHNRHSWLEALESAKTRIWIRPYAGRFS